MLIILNNIYIGEKNKNYIKYLKMDKVKTIINKNEGKFYLLKN